MQSSKAISLRYILLIGFLEVLSVAAFSLTGKRALVTGSSGGIGAGIAKTLAQEGVDIFVHYHSRKEGALSTRRSIEEVGGRCGGIVQCDFRSPIAISEMFDRIDEVWVDGIDIVVNNAGIITKLAIDDDDNACSAWHETMAVNLHAPLQISRLAKQRMKGSDGGVIVNVSSIHGDRSVEFMTAYAASKAALDTLTRGLALEYAQDKVRVNGIAPGVVPVERTAAAFENPEVVQMWLPHLPVDRLGDVKSIADATLPLITNDWITGTTWKIDGGMMARSNMPVRPRPAVPARGEPDDIIDKASLE